MKKFLMIVILLLLICTATSMAMDAQNTIYVDFPRFIKGIYPFSYETIISDQQTISLGYTYYSTNVLYDGNASVSGYSVQLGTAHYFKEALDGPYWAVDAGYNQLETNGDTDFINGSSYELQARFGIKRIFDNGFTLDLSGGYNVFFPRDKVKDGTVAGFTIGYSW